jgi:hypothetical protein
MLIKKRFVSTHERDTLRVRDQLFRLVVIDGKLADCCSGRGPDEVTLKAAGLGQP